MSTNRSGLDYYIIEGTVVPGDYKGYVADKITGVWGGPAKIVPPPQVESGLVHQIGEDPQQHTINKISKALGDLISNKELINRRDWR